ncbi:MAG: hypothetical protein K5984_05605 [Bacteroidales bacterium]|nr:hypothetical protein [Bacteroidales bacterium]
MRKIFTIMAAVAASILFILPADAQMKITTKKAKLSDFETKTTKVVLTGNSIDDETLKAEIKAVWTISPYEFCTLEEFENIKSSTNYYFLMTVQGQFKKESVPGIDFLTLVKGGEGSENGVGEMYEVVTVPYKASTASSGRETVYLGALLDIIQDYTRKAISSDFKGYTGLTLYNTALGKTKTKDILFSVDDLSPSVGQATIKDAMGNGMLIAEEDEVDSKFENGATNTVVSYIVYPSDAMVGSYCFKMLIDAENHDLYYFKKHKISAKQAPGFLLSDVKVIKAVR